MDKKEFLRIIYETENLIEATIATEPYTMSQHAVTNLLHENEDSLAFGLNEVTANAYYYHYLMVHFLNKLLGRNRTFYKEKFLGEEKLHSTNREKETNKLREIK